MTPLIVLALLVGTPVVLAILLRVSSVFLYLAVAAGAFLASSVGDDVVFALETFIRGANASFGIKLTMIGIPVALTLYFLRKTMPSTQFLLQILPLVATGLFLAVVAFNEFSSGLQGSIKADPIGNAFYQASDLIVAVAALLNLFLAWRAYRHKPKHGHKKH